MLPIISFPSFSIPSLAPVRQGPDSGAEGQAARADRIHSGLSALLHPGGRRARLLRARKLLLHEDAKVVPKGACRMAA